MTLNELRTNGGFVRETSCREREHYRNKNGATLLTKAKAKGRAKATQRDAKAASIRTNKRRPFSHHRHRSPYAVTSLIRTPIRKVGLYTHLESDQRVLADRSRYQRRIHTLHLHRQWYLNNCTQRRQGIHTTRRSLPLRAFLRDAGRTTRVKVDNVEHCRPVRTGYRFPRNLSESTDAREIRKASFNIHTPLDERMSFTPLFPRKDQRLTRMHDTTQDRACGYTHTECWVGFIRPRVASPAGHFDYHELVRRVVVEVVRGRSGGTVAGV
jgi:hypothetical protein